MVKSALLSLWYRLPWAGFRVVAVVDAADEIPDQIPSKGAVVVGSLAGPTWIAFDCPCVDRHRVILNLDTRRRPVWKLSGTRPLSLSPSIDELRGRIRCHYFIRKGRVWWADDTTNTEVHR